LSAKFSIEGFIAGFKEQVEKDTQREAKRLEEMETVECMDCGQELGRGQRVSFEARLCRACRRGREVI